MNLKEKIIKLNKGFSLIELLTVIVILGILYAVGSSSYKKYKISAYVSAVNSTVKVMETALETCLIRKSLSECDSFEKLNIKCERMYPSGTFSANIGSYQEINGVICFGKKGFTGDICLTAFYGTFGSNVDLRGACVDSSGTFIKSTGKSGNANNGRCVWGKCS